VISSSLIEPDGITLWQLIERRAELTPDAIMLIDESGRALTFGEYREHAERVAAGLAGLGITAGAAVTWQLPTTIETFLVKAALARIGACQNPIIPSYREREVQHVLQQTQAQFVVVPGIWRGFDYSAMMRTVKLDKLSPPLVIEVARDTIPTGDPATLGPAPQDPNTVRWIHFTTGSTSAPKGVLHTDASIILGGWVVSERLHFDADVVGAVPFAVAHIGGTNFLSAALTAGFRGVTFERFEPAAAESILRKNKVSFCGGAVPFAEILMAMNRSRRDSDGRSLPDLRLMLGGSGPTVPAKHAQIEEELGVTYCPAYGMTEVPCVTIGDLFDTDEQHRFTDGSPVRGAEVRIWHSEGRPADRGEDGEVQVRGPMVCRGYIDPEATAEAFLDGWFRTGDLGHIREDGRLQLTGRLKDIVIRKGENISIREIEELLAEHPDIQRVAILGLPDLERGERVCAVVQLRVGRPDLDLPAMQDYLRAAGLATYKLPEQLVLVDEMPVQGAMLKISKPELRKWLVQADKI
jgi:acyl-CoA synthetase (AMP-forming)/AMP-acid ligase II